jgi:hypothetical protein
MAPILLDQSIVAGRPYLRISAHRDHLDRRIVMTPIGAGGG